MLQHHANVTLHPYTHTLKLERGRKDSSILRACTCKMGKIESRLETRDPVTARYKGQRRVREKAPERWLNAEVTMC
jgi:hypothetical protein